MAGAGDPPPAASTSGGAGDAGYAAPPPAVAAAAAVLRHHDSANSSGGHLGYACAPLSSLNSGADYERRMTTVGAAHPMFQFVFDAGGRLLAANHAAMRNLRERLGDRAAYTLPAYLSLGEPEGGATSEEHCRAALEAIFERGLRSFRLPQKRWSQRVPGKYRWVLYEMWPMADPVSGQPAMLVTEQNISEVRTHRTAPYCGREEGGTGGHWGRGRGAGAGAGRRARGAPARAAAVPPRPRTAGQRAPPPLPLSPCR